MTIKLLQWNVWCKENPQNIARVVKDINPDIACLQELNPDSEAFISKETGMEFYYHQAQVWQDREQGNGIFSKFPIENKTFNHLQDPKTSPSNATNQGRIYLEATIGSLTIGTTHLSFESDFSDSDIKLQEAEKLEKIISQKHTNYILAADLNATPSSLVLAKIAKHLTNLGPDLDIKSWRDSRIDYVFGTPDIKVESSEVLKTDFSDHLPILISVESDSHK